MPASRALRPRQPAAVMDIAAQSRDLSAGRVARGSVEMTTLLVTHAACAGHDMGEGHPERPARLRAVDQALESEKFQMLARDSAPRAPIEAVTRVHPAAYVAAIEQASPTQGRVRVDQDTSMSPGTWEAAIRAAGHHAETSTPMGFCFFNNAAIAARHAQAVHKLERVAIVDFDVHHGNGTQDIFWNDNSVLYASTHQMPLFPGTGARSERGEHDQIVNAPLSAGDGGEAFREAFDVAILPRLEAFSPDLIIISAGFDAHHRDPLGNINLREEDFAWATRKIMAIARRQCGHRVVSLLEGGYDLEGLGRSVAAHVTALMEN